MSVDAGPFTDAENAVRVWLRTLNLAGVGARVFFGFPTGNPTLPLILVARIGGGPQPGEAPLSDVRLSFEVWANTKEDAAVAATALGNALWVAQSVLIDLHSYLYGFHGINVIWAPDEAAKLIRYVVDAEATIGPR